MAHVHSKETEEAFARRLAEWYESTTRRVGFDAHHRKLVVLVEPLPGTLREVVADYLVDCSDSAEDEDLVAEVRAGDFDRELQEWATTMAHYPMMESLYARKEEQRLRGLFLDKFMEGMAALCASFTTAGAEFIRVGRIVLDSISESTLQELAREAETEGGGDTTDPDPGDQTPVRGRVLDGEQGGDHHRPPPP